MTVIGRTILCDRPRPEIGNIRIVSSKSGPRQALAAGTDSASRRSVRIVPAKPTPRRLSSVATRLPFPDRRICLVTAVLLLVGAVPASAQNPAVVVTIDATANRHPINPNIYGVAYASMAPANPAGLAIATSR